MAVVTTKSAQITNRDATPAVLSNSFIAASSLNRKQAIVAVANGDSVGSKLIFFQIPSNAYVSSLKTSAPDIGTTTAGDIGLYRTVADGGAVVDADFFTAAVSYNGGAVTKSEKLYGNVVTIANAEKRIWELLGLTSDPMIFYDVVVTLTGAADAAGTIQLECDYDI